MRVLKKVQLNTHTFVVEFESLLYRGDGSEHRQSVDSALDVGSCAKLISQHLGHSGDLIFRRDDQRNHTGPITEKQKETEQEREKILSQHSQTP